MVSTSHQNRALTRYGQAPMSPNPIHYAGLGGIIGRHLHLNLVPNHQPDETLAHLSGNMRKNLVFTGKLDLEHGSGKNGRDGSLNLNSLVFPICPLLGSTVVRAAPPAPAPSSSSSWWSCDNLFLGWM